MDYSHRTLAVDISKHQQTLTAWGTSLCWWANGVGRWGSSSGELKSLLDLVFSNFSSESVLRAVRNGSVVPASLGLTQARYNIGGGEAPKYQHFMRAGGAVEGYQDARGRWNWSADASQRAVLAGALERGVGLVQAFSNSPPMWMTKSGSATGAHGGGSNLQDKYYGAFAKYLARVVKRFATDPKMLDGRTLVFDTVTPLNEPNSDWWAFGNDQEGCHFSPPEQARILSELAAALRAEGVTRTGISAVEENQIDMSYESLSEYPAAAVAELGLVTTHTYGAPRWARSALASWASEHGKPLWNSEFGTGDGPLQGGLELARAIVADLTELKCTVWTLWQVVDLDDTLDRSGWGHIAATDTLARHSFKVRKQYYAFKQFTAFIRPGSTLLHVGTSSPSVTAIGALPPQPLSPIGAGPALVLVVANSAKVKVDARLDITGAAGPVAVSAVKAYLTDAHHNCKGVKAPPVVDRFVVAVLRPRSITTLIIDLQESAAFTRLVV